MSTLAMTGAGGFLGWHVRVLHFASQQQAPEAVALGHRFDRADAGKVCNRADRLVHLAGVNRGSDDEVRDGNVDMARQLAEVLRICATPPRVVVYANSIQSGNATVYGEAKEQAAAVLRAACEDRGVRFVDLRLPNLFGEHGRPFYNSVVATFCHLITRGAPVAIAQDKELDLMHAQAAAAALLEVQDEPEFAAYRTHRITVSEIARRVEWFHALYEVTEIPDLTDPFDRDLFNTYRSFAFDQRHSLPLAPRTDTRGYLVETVKSHGGEGQTFFSTTHVGITRGQHYHLRKIERFIVLDGAARISLRRMFTDTKVDIDVVGEEPVAVDMPIGWVHNIRNTHASRDLLTQFWTNEIFNPDDTDTFHQEV